jgi:hypothetical protein
MRDKFDLFIKFSVTRTVPSTRTESVGLRADARGVMVFAPRQFYRDPKFTVDPGRAKTTPPRPRTGN